MNVLRCIFISIILSFGGVHFSFAQNLIERSSNNSSLISEVDTEYLLHPEYNKFALDIPIENIELLQLRTENSKTFLGVDGTYRVQHVGGIYHYKDNQGNWLTIQENISFQNNKYGIYNTELPISVYPVSGLSEMTLLKSGEKIEFGNLTKLELLDENKNITNIHSSEIENHFVNGNTIVLENIFDNIDRIQFINYWDLRTDYIIKQRLNFPENVKYMQISDFMKLPQNWTLQYDDGEWTELGWKGSLKIQDQNGNILSTISIPKYFDSSVKNSTMSSDNAMIGAFKIEQENNGYSIRLVIPVDWLNNPDLIYPVFIDPTTTNTYTLNQGVEDVYTLYSANCQATMNLNFPATGTYQVINTNTSYQVWSKGFLASWSSMNFYADKVEQHSRVGSLNGWSPTQYGVGTNFNGPWGVNQNSMYYNLTNLTIANGCYNNQPTIPFYWQGYQDFLPYGAGPAIINLFGCITTYHELVVNTWTVTVDYNIIGDPNPQFNNPGPICSGDNLTLPSTSLNGITGSWSPSPNNTQTTTYTFTPTQGCINTITMTVVVDNFTNPTFTNPGPICSGDALTLPTTSTNGVNGTWLPNPNNTQTTTYTFTPNNTGTSCPAIPIDMEVVVNDIPNVVAGSNVSICLGDQVTLTASNPDGAVITWNNNISDGITFTPNTSGGTIYTVTATLNNCSSQDSLLVDVHPNPIVQAGSNQTACEGDQVTLTATGADMYSWTNGISNGVSFVPPLGTNAYEVVGTNNFGCSDTTQVILTVHPLPVFLLSSINPSCGNNDGEIIFTGLNSSANYTISYDYTNYISSNSFGPTSYTSDGSGEIIITGLYEGVYSNFIVTSPEGCSKAFPVNEVLYDPAGPNITAPNDFDICLGDTITLSVTNPNGAIISWDNNISDGIPFAPSITGSITYTVTGTIDDCVVYDQVIVNVHTSPNVQAGPNQTICEGEMVTLSGNGADSYTWDNGVHDGIPFLPSVTTTYTVIGTDAYGCINSDQVTVFVADNFAADFIGVEQIGCEPHQVIFSNLTNANFSSCKWEFGDGGTSNNCNLASHTYNNSGTYTVTLTVTDVNGCVSSHTEKDYIIVTQKPKASFWANPTTVNLTEPTVNFHNSSKGATDYIWDFGDYSLPDYTENPTHKFPDDKSGSYVVTLIAQNGEDCSDTTKMVITVEEDLIFYMPNSFTPDNDNFNDVFTPVFTSGFDSRDFTFLIFNRWGELLFESHDSTAGWDGTYGGKIVQEGVYVWKIDIKLSKNDERKSFTGHFSLIK